MFSLLDLYERRRQKIMAGHVQGDRILDIGCAALPNTYLPEGKAIGFDVDTCISSAGYKQIVRGNVKEIRYHFPAKSFDTVLAGEIIEHMSDPYGFLGDIRYLIRPGGRIILSTPNLLGFPVFLFEYFQSRHHYFTSEHLYYFTPRWVVRMLDKTGFQAISLFPVGLWLFGIPIPCVPCVYSYQIVYIGHLPNEIKTQI